MVVRKLYRHSKTAALCFVAFIALFIYINYKWGVVASPIYQLGMFSGITHKTDTQTIYTLYSDNKPVVLNHLPFVHNDMLLVSLARYESHAQHNKDVMEVFNKFAIRMFNKPLPPAVYTQEIDVKVVSAWLKQLMISYGIPVKTLSVVSDKYIWYNGGLKKVRESESNTLFAADL